MAVWSAQSATRLNFNRDQDAINAAGEVIG